MKLSTVRRALGVSMATTALAVSVVACGSGSDDGGSDDAGKNGKGSDGGKGASSAPGESGGGSDSDSGGSGSDDSGSDGSGSGSGSERKLSAAELAKLLLAKADLTGPLKGYVVEKPGPDEVDTSGGMKATGSECQPLIDTLNEVAPAGAAETERRAVMGPKAKRLEEGLGSQVALSSYESAADAKKTLDALQTAVDNCGDGFKATGTSDEDNQEFTRVDTAKAPEGADQGVAYDLVGDLAEGEEVAEGMSSEMPMKFVYARSGSTVAMFLTYNPFDPKKTAFPKGLIDAQIKKLTGDAGA
ncbi:hypothetical protein [Streptomyces triticagri]|uniref:hypothetical protein n=1 Tax=Streptomyces triticagri TaxID=2293568 RepID=UPI000FFB9730|nr:hypothetical protein [Streptomyces triticagri]